MSGRGLTSPCPVLSERREAARSWTAHATASDEGGGGIDGRGSALPRFQYVPLPWPHAAILARGRA